ncbi:oxaloacetate decarboxylase subunit gamma [Enterovibrio norvegicus]|uniref:Probable oxaloacetate decarboxylase gamma chain n=2 Tax=Enterovibrio norvegicus TaxID=188144 RepID=A0A2N7LAL5_9GAMM|nr:oxaloacetate decarboxylase subunit gamma [Enterovibrio norvegicus]MCC4800926.1 oxaloacetate decarboxylase subunit gamma [Enterovibrio norvegicus]OEE46306.1 oxaloacetate decarboxylase subunit gamma [Enterovibrio norvegicus]OEF51143.1 oxaloacetate decarboxylase subunit gamma [Enterovibrio norvegicus]OEF57321.1 oxaloacetate decarboxylase subunit gamma [Enterovibrio norvegicus]PMH59409.1 oxaloacetate decarboxylase subunit gamma [Enterovibrio norvegicus]
MDLGSTLQQAATLMFTGMAVVFVFLTILIVLVKLMSRIVPEELPPQIASTSTPTQNNGQIPGETIAAISAAVNKYRSRQR